MSFRENLKSELEYSGMLVKELAAQSGVKKKTIDSYLGSQGCTPSVEAAVKIARALGVSVEYLVTGKESMKNRPISSLHSDVQEIVHVSERLNPQDRFIILNLARIIQKANSINRKKMPEQKFHI
jgi:transcriptional regulator with XRE-family HTH domain